MKHKIKGKLSNSNGLDLAMHVSFILFVLSFEYTLSLFSVLSCLVDLSNHVFSSIFVVLLARHSKCVPLLVLNRDGVSVVYIIYILVAFIRCDCKSFVWSIAFSFSS